MAIVPPGLAPLSVQDAPNTRLAGFLVWAYRSAANRRGLKGTIRGGVAPSKIIYCLKNKPTSDLSRRVTIEPAGRLKSEELTPEMRKDFIAL